ncbi:MAG: peptidyl-prolyl cis-trans isomerase [Proteobacteria bacterium]|nr:peptidyl-prolyl cis-trans isomerase [Pseudomonadota bacterium]
MAFVDKETIKKEENPMVIMETSEGTIKIELWADKAPITVTNFLSYVDEGLFDSTIFHRVIENFMLQGGGFDADMKEKATKEPIKNEASADLKNNRGTIAMARTNVIDSATSQFFINHKDNDFLNHRDDTAGGFGYAVFGKVVEGMDVVDKISKVETGNRGFHQDVPLIPVVIKSVKRLEKE